MILYFSYIKEHSSTRTTTKMTSIRQQQEEELDIGCIENQLDNMLYQENMDWSFDKPESGKYETIYIIRREEEEEEKCDCGEKMMLDSIEPYCDSYAGCGENVEVWIVHPSGKFKIKKEEKCIVPDCYAYGIIEWKAMDGKVCRECCKRINKKFEC